jgi:hypothetical protein
MQKTNAAYLEFHTYDLCVLTGSGAHLASCSMRTKGHFPGVKHGQSMTLTTNPQLVLRLMSRSYTFSLYKHLHGV